MWVEYFVSDQYFDVFQVNSFIYERNRMSDLLLDTFLIGKKWYYEQDMTKKSRLNNLYGKPCKNADF